MNAHDLKDYIIEDTNRINIILEDINCHGIREYGKDFRCGLPNHHNTTSVRVRKQTLSVAIYLSDEGKIGGDIFTLIMHIKEISFPQTIRYVHKLLNLEYKIYGEIVNAQPKNHILSMFRNIRKETKSVTSSQYDFNTYPENILNKYYDYYHIDYIKDGCMPSVMKMLDIKYDFISKRVIIPHRAWDTGEILGIFGRTTLPNYKELDIPKFFGIIPYDKSGNLYGLYIGYKSILEKGYVIVSEGEKSVIQSLSMGLDGVVAVGSHFISPEQRKILLGLNVDIIIAFDKGIGIDYIREVCSQFRGIRNVYYIYDNDDILDNTESPFDNGRMIFDIMFDEKIKYEGEKEDSNVNYK